MTAKYFSNTDHISSAVTPSPGLPTLNVGVQVMHVAARSPKERAFFLFLERAD